MIEAGVLVGFARDVASKLVVQTMLGSATLLAQSTAGPAALRAEVTSPGGTTAAGLRELEAHGLRSAILDAVSAATLRSRELGASESSACGPSEPGQESAAETRAARRRIAPRAAADAGRADRAGRRSRARPRSGPGPTELRRTVERLALGDRRALGELAPMAGPDARPRRGPRSPGSSVRRPTPPVIDPPARSPRRGVAAARVREVAAAGGARIAIATARPASLLTLHLAFAALARDARRRGRRPRRLRPDPRRRPHAALAALGRRRRGRERRRRVVRHPRRRSGARMVVRDPAPVARHRRRPVRGGRVGARDRGRRARGSRPARRWRSRRRAAAGAPSSRCTPTGRRGPTG